MVTGRTDEVLATPSPAQPDPMLQAMDSGKEKKYVQSPFGSMRSALAFDHLGGPTTFGMLSWRNNIAVRQNAVAAEAFCD